MSSPASNIKKRGPKTTSMDRPRHSSTRRKRFKSTCREEVAFLDRYLSSDLDERRRARFENHLAVCPDCVAFLRTYKSTIALTRKFLSNEDHPSSSFALSLERQSARINRR